MAKEEQRVAKQWQGGAWLSLARDMTSKEMHCEGKAWQRTAARCKSKAVRKAKVRKRAVEKRAARDLRRCDLLRLVLQWNGRELLRNAVEWNCGEMQWKCPDVPRKARD